ncbi:hypothetical protein EPN52_08680 [bacterium]|nr:MAG: hypothetical protein EPN52_08680 [bacterium]
MRELKNEIAWSWSRDSVYRRCKRAYYWTYYGSWGWWSEDASATQRKAGFLKALSDLDRLVGSSIHEPLAVAIHLRRPGERGVPFERIATQAREMFERCVRLARRRIGDGVDDARSGAGQLAERYYGSADVEERVVQARVKLESNLEGLRQSPYARIPFAHAAHDLLWVDPVAHTAIMSPSETWDAQRTTLADGTTIYGSPDVVVKGNDGFVHILDWKTGRLSAPGDLQIGAYALFIHRKLGTPLEEMKGHFVHFLAPDEHQAVAIDALAEKAALVHGMIVEFLRDLGARLTDPRANRADDIERFPMIEPGPICARCKFRELCGRAGV